MFDEVYEVETWSFNSCPETFYPFVAPSKALQVPSISLNWGYMACDSGYQ